MDEVQARIDRLWNQAILIDGLGWSYVERASALLSGAEGTPQDQIDLAVQAGLTGSNQYLASHDADDFNAAIHRFWRLFGLLDVRPDRLQRSSLSRS